MLAAIEAKDTNADEATTSILNMHMNTYSASDILSPFPDTKTDSGHISHLPHRLGGIPNMIRPAPAEAH